MKGKTKAYPLCKAAPLNREYFSLFDEPLYDSEVAVSGCERLEFFQRPVSHSALHAKGSLDGKHYQDTNLQESAMLGYPREFRVRGFSVTFQEGADIDDLESIINGGYFQFAFCGRRPYLTVPLLRLVKSRPFYTFSIRKLCTKEQIERAQDQHWKQLRRHYGKDFNKTVGKMFAQEQKRRKEQALFAGTESNIKPGDKFMVTLAWPRPLKIMSSVKILVCIEGETLGVE